jgi:predicted metal-dependent TIM-barrel fold hydrolase
MYARTTDDYEKMALAGVEAICEPAFWLGEPRTHAGTFYDYFSHLCNFENSRAARYGIEQHVLLAVNPRESNNIGLAREVQAELPKFLEHPKVVAVGEIGFDDITDEEDEIIRGHVEHAKAAGLPIMVHTPHKHKLKGTIRTLDIMKEMDVDMGKVIMDHNTEETIKVSLDSGAWCGHTIYPVTKLSPERFANIVEEYGTERILCNSACDWGVSDPLSVARIALELRQRGMARESIQKLIWNNPVEFFSQSGKFSVKD